MDRFASLVTAGLLLFGAAGCAGDDSSSTSPTSEAVPSPTSTTAPAPGLEEGDRYVALGSSIASGYGISVQSTSCGRSTRSYPNLIAARYGLELVDLSCGAASIPHVVDSPQGENPPQLSLVAPDTKLITVSIGGNDIRYNGTALACGDPEFVCTAPEELDAFVAATGPALRDMIERIQAAAPEATIVFVTYPREVPDANCPELSFTDEEAEIVGSMGERLQEIFVEVAEESDVVFVDPYSAPGDHTGCAPASERWVAGYRADDGFAYHPTALGHEVMAEMIAAELGD